MGFNVICKTSEERDKETKELFEQMKPYLLEGKSYAQAVMIVKNTKTSYSHTRWFKDLVKYGESQGYPKNDFTQKYKSGIINVQLNKYKHSRTGYYWIYTYHDEQGNQRRMFDTDLVNLKNRVDEKELPWIIANEFKAEKSFKYNRELQANKRPKKEWARGRKTSSGVKYVSKLANKDSKQGFYWGYRYGSLNLHSSSLETLRTRVEEHGGAWQIIDEKLYEKNIQNEGG